MHSYANLKLKLFIRGFDEEAVETALKRVSELGYIDDAKYAEAWVLSRIARHPEGRFLLLSNLIKKGINRELAQSTIDRLYSRDMEIECALKIRTKLTESRNYTQEELYSKLYRKGFSYEIIHAVLEN